LPGGRSAVVEVKFLRTKALLPSTLLLIANQVELIRRNLRASYGIIVLAGNAPAAARQVLSDFPDILVYDAGALAFLSAKHPHLLREFDDFIRVAAPFSNLSEPEPNKVSLKDDLAKVAGLSSVTPKPSEARGKEFCVEIRSIKTGKKNAKQFEDRVIEALKYIFEKDLTAWAAQKSSDTGLSYYDVVARVASEHDFWTAIATQFRSRYIIFEFKSYSSKIKQGQIYTTEKYLFGPALRSTAIIISRKGADKNGLAAARGALREHGKLLINLDIDDLCEMLHLRDRGDDHNSVLVDRVDEMLVKLER